MGDSYREILVQRETSAIGKLLKGMIPAMAVICLVTGMMFWPLLIGAVGFGLLTFFAAPKLEVEYEYLYVNGELDVDAIYSRQKRKRIGSFDMSVLEILAPEKSHALDSYLNRSGAKVLDFTSRKAPEKTYVMVFNQDKGQQIIKVELDPELIGEIRRIAPRKVVDCPAAIRPF